MINIAIVDDHPIVVDGLSEILNRPAEFNVVGAFTQPHQLYRLLPTTRVDVVILDISMPNIDGYDVMRHLKERQSATKVLALTVLNKGPEVRRILEHGAHGYLEKNATQDKITEAIRRVHHHGIFLEDRVSEKLVQSDHEQHRPSKRTTELPNVSEREKEVIRCILQKMRNKKIADTLCISENTVRSHKKNIFSKFNVGNTQELIIEIHEKGYRF